MGLHDAPVGDLNDQADMSAWPDFLDRGSVIQDVDCSTEYSAGKTRAEELHNSEEEEC
ncbi:hypothetical protein PILCRDRAFT_812755 [Piloderma croceum F 1598]|uniref:Uncharacterized protein n=1 Tax=Piloderma croceum (strain F 1598) TaxID=765440 RepID=A0A0C3BTS7_PILCF|nr:hypothetical protein PILCRDRAFT_812755 [Piloderma croceum F 1598]